MVELWFRYGKTEVFAEVEESLEVLKPVESVVDENKVVEQLRETADSRLDTVVLDYVYSVEGFDQVVSTSLRTLAEAGGELKVYASFWRYVDSAVEKLLLSHVNQLLRDLNLGGAHPLRNPQSLDPSKTLLLSPAAYWGGEILSASDFCRKFGLSLRTLSPIVGSGGCVADVVAGELKDVAQTSVEKASALSIYTPERPAEILLVGGPGHPVDSRFSACMYLAGSVLRTDPGKVVVLMLESAEGLGDEWLLKLLKGEQVDEPLAVKFWDVWKNVVEMHKVVVVTALPVTLVSRILNARHADTLDQALLYARRVKSRESRVLAAPNVSGTCLTGF